MRHTEINIAESNVGKQCLQSTSGRYKAFYYNVFNLLSGGQLALLFPEPE